MANPTPTFQPLPSDSKEVRITNLSLTIKDTEYNHNLENSLKQLIVQSRSGGVTRLSFVLGGTITDWITIHAGATLSLQSLQFSGKLLSLQNTKDNAIIEIMELY